MKGQRQPTKLGLLVSHVLCDIVSEVDYFFLISSIWLWVAILILKFMKSQAWQLQSKIALYKHCLLLLLKGLLFSLSKAMRMWSGIMCLKSYWSELNWKLRLPKWILLDSWACFVHESHYWISVGCKLACVFHYYDCDQWVINEYSQFYLTMLLLRNSGVKWNV